MSELGIGVVDGLYNAVQRGSVYCMRCIYGLAFRTMSQDLGRMLPKLNFPMVRTCFQASVSLSGLLLDS